MEVIDIEIEKIKVIENVRQAELKEDLAELMQSIKYTGLMQPIGVKETNKDYVLIWGFRRLTAFKNLGYKKIPAVIFVNNEEEMSEEDFLIANASENIHHKQNSPIELGRIVKKLRESMSISEIASRMGLSKSRIESVQGSLRKIPLRFRADVKFFETSQSKDKKGKIPFGLAHAVANTKLLNMVEKELVLEWAVKNDKTIEDVYGIKRLLRSGCSLKEALININKWRGVSFKFLMNKETFTKITEKQSLNSLIQELLNTKYGKDTCFGL